MVEQGSYDDLVAASGYVSTLASVSHVVNTSRAPNVTLNDDTIQELILDDEATDTISRRTGDWSVYKYYFQRIGWPLLLTFFICSALFIFGLIIPRGCYSTQPKTFANGSQEVWLQYWTRANEERPNQNVAYWLGGYTVLGVLSLVATFLANWYFRFDLTPSCANIDSGCSL